MLVTRPRRPRLARREWTCWSGSSKRGRRSTSWPPERDVRAPRRHGARRGAGGRRRSDARVRDRPRSPATSRGSQQRAAVRLRALLKSAGRRRRVGPGASRPSRAPARRRGTHRGRRPRTRRRSRSTPSSRVAGGTPVDVDLRRPAVR